MSYTLALGPFAPSWIGPQRLVLTVEGEIVTDIDYRAGYNERGCAERLPRLELDQALHLVTRICTIDSHAHALAFCQALESLAHVNISERAAWIRCMIAEVERLSSHVRALHALFGALGQWRRVLVLQDLLTHARSIMALLSGKPQLPDMCLPGGVYRDVRDDDSQQVLVLTAMLKDGLSRLIDQIITVDEPALLARTVDVGLLTQTVAEQYALRGPMARASGLEYDARLDVPYAAYHEAGISRIKQDGGDVHARMVVFLLEAFASLTFVEHAVQNLPDGAMQAAFPPDLPAGETSSAVESAHGLLRYTVQSDGRRLSNVTIDAPRQIDRLLARTLFVGTLLDNVVLIALSTDMCVACAEG